MKLVDIAKLLPSYSQIVEVEDYFLGTGFMFIIGEIPGLFLLDHRIITGESYFSFADAGLLDAK